MNENLLKTEKMVLTAVSFTHIQKNWMSFEHGLLTLLSHSLRRFPKISAEIFLFYYHLHGPPFELWTIICSDCCEMEMAAVTGEQS